MHTNNNFYSGTSGLVLPVSQAFYPDEFKGKSRLIYYSSLLNSVEINSSFYKMPKAATVFNWAESVGNNFKFTFKLPKAISHASALNYNEDDVHVFMETVNKIGNKKGCLLVQFPPRLKNDRLKQVEHLIQKLRAADPENLWQVAIEFRNVSWYQNEVYDMLNQHNVCLVIHDLPASQTPLIQSNVTSSYFRFHGPGGRYRGSYTDEFLLEYAQRIKAFLQEEKTVYCYFNNTMGDALKNLQRLNILIEADVT